MCEYKEETVFVKTYTCHVLEVNIRGSAEINLIVGDHWSVRNHNDVKGLTFDNWNAGGKNLAIFPKGFYKFFPNLISIRILNTNWTSVLSTDFALWNNLTYLLVRESEIGKLEADTFWYLPRLTTLAVEESNIKELSQDFFKKIPNLIRFYANNNRIRALDGDLFQNSPKLDYISFRNNLIQNVGLNLLSN